MTLNTLDDNTTFWSPYYTALENAVAGNAIAAGCAISKGTGDWDIDVTSGAIIDDWSEQSVNSGTVALTDPASDADMDAGESRIDLVTANVSAGGLAAVEGAAATNPDAPDVPAGEVILGFVVIAESDSTAADSDIIDIPVFNPPERSTSIKIWSGAISDIPTGWVLCDGNNSTPNLQDKFVVGAGNTFSVDGTGGESTHTLATGELPSGILQLPGGDRSGSSGNTYGTIGAGSAHENKPPYHALAYIMKT